MERIKRILALGLVVATLIIAVTGCGASKNNVAIINNEKISEPLYRICLWITQRGFESVMPSIWEMEDIEGKTPEEYAKDSVLSSLKLSIAAKEEADELGITLTRDEKKEIKALAKSKREANEAFAKAYNIKEKYFEEFVTYDVLVDKVIEKLGESYLPNEDEIAEMIGQIKHENDTVDFEQILISTRNEQGDLIPNDKLDLAKDEAEEVLERALSGEEFTKLMEQYTDDEAYHLGQTVYSVKKGEVSDELEEVVFNLAEEGKVYGQIVETENGYEIVKVIKRNLMDESVAREEAIKRVQAKFASNELIEKSALLKVEKLPAYDEMHIITDVSTQ